MSHHDNAQNRFGSARFATFAEIKRAGFFDKQPHSIFVGFFDRKPLWYSAAGGMIISAGARSGKLRDFLAYSLLPGVLQRTSLVMLDLKGEGAAIAQLQVQDRKFMLCWNPAALHNLVQHRINPVDYIRYDSPTLVSDVKVFCYNSLPPSGAAQSQYFEQRGQEYLEGIILTLTKLKGVLTLPDLYDVINLIPGSGDAWLQFAFEMSEMRRAGFPIAARIEEEIAASREDSGGGFQGILGEIFKAFSALSDPILRASVSPPFDASLADLCRSDQAYQLHLMPPPEFVQPWKAVIKAFFVGAMIYKSRAPSAPRQVWILDECAKLGAFPLVGEMHTYGAGIGILPVSVVQSNSQFKTTMAEGEIIIPSSSACQLYFAARDLPSAVEISQRLGTQTLHYDDPFIQARARLAKRHAMDVIVNGTDPFAAAREHRHYASEAVTASQQQRDLRTPAEVLNMPDNKAYLFVDGLDHPILVDRKPYYEQRKLAGKFMPNPYHPPLDRVRVKRRIGTSVLRVIHERAPKRFAHYPQYKDGVWARLK